MVMIKSPETRNGLVQRRIQIEESIWHEWVKGACFGINTWGGLGLGLLVSFLDQVLKIFYYFKKKVNMCTLYSLEVCTLFQVRVFSF